jgi:hypothetical protein
VEFLGGEVCPKITIKRKTPRLFYSIKENSQDFFIQKNPLFLRKIGGKKIHNLRFL